MSTILLRARVRTGILLLIFPIAALAQPAAPVRLVAEPIGCGSRTPISPQHTPGDADSLFHITTGGSYYLRHDVIGQPGKHGIKISTTDAVTLDLSGHALTGVPGSLHGILAVGTCTVRNGSVSSWGLAGLHVGEGTVSGVAAHFNGQEGIRGLWGNLIYDCRTEHNGGPGISLGDVSQVRNCVSKGNAEAGIRLDGAGLISGCVVYANGGGIDAGLATIRDCMLFSNGPFAIRVSAAAQVLHNHIATATVAIEVTAGGNRIEANTIFGAQTGILVTGEGNRIEGNTVSSCTTGYDVNGAANLLSRNTSTANTTHFDIAPGNSFGPIVDVAGAGDISALAGSQHPAANFTH